NVFVRSTQVQSGVMITAEDLAHGMGIPGRKLRAWLRKNVPGHIFHDRWIFTRAQADDIKRRFPPR
ncbi:MAG: hypothetical protein JWN99_1049, partial [Ilumatobacteraceae bacterium]|nr:hypothetical protein [Ilumatobacteraceae bacterium]